MPTLADLLYVVLFAVVWPLVDYFVFWPAFLRRFQADPARARTWIYAWTIAKQWALVAVGAALWLSNDRSWTSFGFSMPDGWRLWVPVALVLLLVGYTVYAAAAVARDARARASVRQQFGKIADLMPHTRTDRYWFWGMSVLTAGFCEEFLFRGYFIWVLATWLGWWGAAALSVPFFASAHAYQGWHGSIGSGILGTFLTLVVALCGSLWPAIVLHALLNLYHEMIAWPVLRERQATDAIIEAGQRVEPQSSSGLDSNPVQSGPRAAGDRGRE